MVIDAKNINHSVRMAFNDPCVNTCDASIGTLEKLSLCERLVPSTYTFASLQTKQCLQLYLARSSGREHHRHLGSMLSGPSMSSEQNAVACCLSIQQKMPGRVDPLLEFENKISNPGGKWCVATSMTPWCHPHGCRGLWQNMSSDIIGT
jgi:hypothetical protein